MRKKLWTYNLSLSKILKGPMGRGGWSFFKFKILLLLASGLVSVWDSSITGSRPRFEHLLYFSRLEFQESSQISVVNPTVRYFEKPLAACQLIQRQLFLLIMMPPPDPWEVKAKPLALQEEEMWPRDAGSDSPEVTWVASWMQSLERKLLMGPMRFSFHHVLSNLSLPKLFLTVTLSSIKNLLPLSLFGLRPLKPDCRPCLGLATSSLALSLDSAAPPHTWHVVLGQNSGFPILSCFTRD